MTTKQKLLDACKEAEQRAEKAFNTLRQQHVHQDGTDPNCLLCQALCNLRSIQSPLIDAIAAAEARGEEPQVCADVDLREIVVVRERAYEVPPDVADVVKRYQVALVRGQI